MCSSRLGHRHSRGTLPRQLSQSQRARAGARDEALFLGVPLSCLGGVQLARGYFGDAAKTAEKFVINPLGCQKMQRMYKTGDIVTWLPQGQLLYLGRNDEMVKLRGFRIAPPPRF